MVLVERNPNMVKIEDEPSNLKVIEFSYDFGDISQAFKDFIFDNIIINIQTSIEIAIPIKVRNVVFYRE